MNFADRFRHLADIERRRIVVPDNVRMRLNRLERPEPWCSFIQGQIRHAIATNAVQQYPAYPAFYERLARFFEVQADHIVVGAGIEEHIRNLFMICTDPGDRVVTLWPTCAMFEIYARAFGVELVKIETDPARPKTLDEFIGSLPESFKLMLLANPGQPVDHCLTIGALEVLAQVCVERGAVLAIDEAYHGFGAPTALGIHDRHENMVVMRTFSKAFGAASIRLGFAAAGPLLKRSLDAVRQSGEVSAFSMQTACVLMDNFETHLEPEIADICRARDSLRDRVRKELGLRAWGHWANHVLIEIGEPKTVATVAHLLAERGVLVRAGMPAPLDRHMLVTCGSSALMYEFFHELRAVL